MLVQATRDIPRGTVALRNARLITMKGDEIIARGDVVVRNNRIVGHRRGRERERSRRAPRKWT